MWSDTTRDHILFQMYQLGNNLLFSRLSLPIAFLNQITEFLKIPYHAGLPFSVSSHYIHSTFFVRGNSNT